MTHKEGTTYYKNHTVTEYNRYCLNGRPCELLVFEQPNTSDYSISFLRMSNQLIVSGDVCDAIFKFNGATNLKEISNYSFKHLLSKCVASPQGVTFSSWCRNHFRNEVYSCIKNAYSNINTLSSVTSFYNTVCKNYGNEHEESSVDFELWLEKDPRNMYAIPNNCIDQLKLSLKPEVKVTNGSLFFGKDYHDNYPSGVTPSRQAHLLFSGFNLAINCITTLQPDWHKNPYC